jgi:hypothetical protein
MKTDRIWGGWDFEGELLAPGAEIPAEQMPASGLVLECAGQVGLGWGHRRRPMLYILWQHVAGEWRELARTSAVNRDWTVDLGPIAKRALDPPQPVLVDPAGAAARVMTSVDHEIEKLDREAQRLVLLAIYDRVAARAVAG